jgi:hypothetical protein
MRITHKNITIYKKKTFKKRKAKKTPKKRTPKKIPKKTLKKTKIIVKGGENDIDNECAICYEELNNPDNPDITLSCQHTFHKNCMINTCRHTRGDCMCPLCRKVLSQEELNELRLATPGPPPRPDLPYLGTIDEFREYINNKLRAPTRNALEKLEHALNEFSGTDKLPPEIFDDVMEFELQQIGPLFRYRFLGILQPSDVPRNPVVNKKYFRYINYEIARDENWAEPDEFEFLDPDDYPSYAYHVYDIF